MKVSHEQREGGELLPLLMMIIRYTTAFPEKFSPPESSNLQNANEKLRRLNFLSSLFHLLLFSVFIVPKIFKNFSSFFTSPLCYTIVSFFIMFSTDLKLHLFNTKQTKTRHLLVSWKRAGCSRLFSDARWENGAKEKIIMKFLALAFLRYTLFFGSVERPRSSSSPFFSLWFT